MWIPSARLIQKNLPCKRHVFLEKKEKGVQAVPQSTLLYAKSEGMERRTEGGKKGEEAA